MVRKPPSRTSLVIVICLVAAICGWTVLVLTAAWLPEWDARVAPAPLQPTSAPGQIAAALALVTEPALIYLSLLFVALWAYRGRMRNLAGALVLMVVLGYGGGWLLKQLIGRQRPADAVQLITAQGYAYPSSHLTAASVGVVAVGTVLVVTRHRRVVQLRWAIIGALILILIGSDRLLLAAHHLSDLIGGVLFGAAAAAVSLLIAGVSVLPPFASNRPRARVARRAVDTDAGPSRHTKKRCAVVYNPARVADWVGFRRALDYELRTRGWAQAMWLETRVDDPGRSQTRRAIELGADLVIAAGGDGTVRVVAAELAESGIPFGVIPAGTGNLLAKNLGIPLDERAAMEVAFGGRTREIDVVQVTIDDDRKDHFVVLAGIGIDAMIMQETNPDLKRAVGSAAYFLAAARNANHPALHATITVDDGEPIRRRAHVLVLGNVGYLQANIPLIPDAKPDDGLLDLLIASARKPTDWLRLTAKVLTRRDRDVDELDRITGSKIRIEVAEGDHFELDGDPAGECHTLEAQVLPGALAIRVPR
ncbi:diacylglycerol kinase family protein [Microlunatus soli]|uniref:Lipid kinase, YegS/Rv2252/BmrU family n=1 Tax=Microlunatus soli TaxID=630515 RepID=A0A1H1TIU8_9ACTN|nr:diacylglycerol kinase family protein [Microlunatus soli]SDS60001.1 lipid kinase, YegS/Rv2252/BmrU family [Microlunatus soli]